MSIRRLLLLVTLAVPVLHGQTKTGIDVLEAERFAPLQQLATKHGGQLRLGILTNPVGLDSQHRRTIDVLRQEAAAAVPGLKVTTLFSAEHGINAAVDGFTINDHIDPASQLPIVSLFGETEAQRRPTAQQLQGIDAVVIDLQDVGVRYWTFQTIVKYFLESSAKSHIDVVVLDRPNPINGIDVQGPLSTPGREDYVNPFPEPMRTGMTMGELAELFNGEGHFGASLTVVKMTGWKRSDWYDNTGVLWVNPSPNLRSLTQAMLYPGTGLIEGTNVNVKGPGEPPFVRFGAPWIHATELSAYLSSRKIPGVSFMPVTYVPAGIEHYPYVGKQVEGVEIIVNDRNVLDVPELGIEAVAALWKLYPQQFQLDRVDRLLLNKEVLEQIRKGTDPREIAAGWQSQLNAFKAIRARYLLY